jgi:hypothetical protein
MIIKVEKRFGSWGVSLIEGSQGFHLQPGSMTKTYAVWMAKMFRHAMANHNAKVIENFKTKRRKK